MSGNDDRYRKSLWRQPQHPLGPVLMADHQMKENNMTNLSQQTTLQACVAALAMLGLGLEGLGANFEEPLYSGQWIRHQRFGEAASLI